MLLSVFLLDCILDEIVPWVFCLTVGNVFLSCQSLYLIKVYVAIVEEANLEVIKRSVKLI